MEDPQYRKLLKVVIFNLTDINVDKRLKCRELKEWLSPNKIEMLNCASFFPDTFPEKLNKTERDFENSHFAENSNRFQQLTSSYDSKMSPFHSPPNEPMIQSQSSFGRAEKT